MLTEVHSFAGCTLQSSAMAERFKMMQLFVATVYRKGWASFIWNEAASCLPVTETYI